MKLYKFLNINILEQYRHPNKRNRTNPDIFNALPLKMYYMKGGGDLVMVRKYLLPY
jgi:hypothetical protein